MKRSLHLNFKPDFWLRNALMGLAFLFLWSSSYGQPYTINIDFGSAQNTTSGAWNNITDPKAGAVENLMNDEGINTGIKIAITDAFNADNGDGLELDEMYGIPASASRDSFFGNTADWGGIEPTAALTLYNLDPDTEYSFSFFASRGGVGDNRETKYTVQGKTTVVENLNAANNASEFAEVEGMLPNEDGTIVISLEKGDNNDNFHGFYYLGTMQITYLNTVAPGPKDISLIYPNGEAALRGGSTVDISWERANVLFVDIDYSTDNGTSWTSIATGVSALEGKYAWTMPEVFSETCLVRITDSDDATVSDTSDQPFTIFEGDNKNYTIVVLGSSTAAGAGTSHPDSAWVRRYANHLSHQKSNFTVINLAVGGFSTTNILPSGNQENNITKALSYNPDAIIINLPSNDAALDRSVQEQKNNYSIIAALAEEARVPLWVTTPQPRNFDAGKIQIQKDMIDATYDMFGDFAIDLWTEFAEENGHIKEVYNSGDGVHLNDLAHRLIFGIIAEVNIDAYIVEENAPDLINIDFGAPDRTSEDWNNITDPEAGAIADLVNARGQSTGISIAITDPFNAINPDGLAAAPILDFADNAATDSFYGNTGIFEGKDEPTAGLTMSNLNPETAYTFTFYASRGGAGENRETQYTVEGEMTEIAALNASDNTANVAQVVDIYPKEDGTISVQIAAGENNAHALKFYYLNALKVQYARVWNEKNLRVVYPNGGERLKVGKTVDIRWESENVENVDIQYSSDHGSSWTSIATAVTTEEGKYSWKVPADASETTLLRIADSEDDEMSDVSDNVFAIMNDDGIHQIAIDFGGADRITSGTWNNITDPKAGSVADLVNREGLTTGISIAITGAFNLPNWVGEIADASLDIPESASTDSFFGNTGGFGDGNTPTAELTVSGLDLDTPYDFSFFASRGGVGDNRETKYTVEGQTTEVVRLNAANNISGVATVSSMLPKADGTVVISLEAGESNNNGDKFYYLGVVKIFYVAAIDDEDDEEDEEPVLGVPSAGAANLVLYPNPASDYLSIGLGQDTQIEELILTNLSGKVMIKESNETRSSTHRMDISNLSPGLYLLSITTNKGVVMSKIIIQ